MTEQQQLRQLIIVFKAPETEPVRVVVNSIEPFALESLLNSQPDLCFFTNYQLHTKSGPINVNRNLSSDVDNGELVITIKVGEFTENEALQHAQNMARIVFSLSSRFQYSDVGQSVVGWLTRNFSDKMANEEDLVLPYPKNFTASLCPRVIKYMDISKEKVTIQDRLQGIVFKLDVKTNEGKEFLVCAAANGWFVKGEKRYPTLHHVLKHISKSYNDNNFLICQKWCSLERLEKTKFEAVNPVTVFQPLKTNKEGVFVTYQQLDLMTGEASLPLNYQIDDVIEAAESEDMKDMVISGVENSFVKQVVEGILMIKRGALAPINDFGNYWWRDLFITKIDDLAEHYADRGGITSAEKTIRNEIRIYHQLKSALDDVRVTHTLIVDYFNERWVAQTLIPGVMTHRAKIVHGPVPEDKSKFVVDPEFKEMFAKCADTWGIAESSVVTAGEKISTSSEVNGVIGTDGIKYILDMHRLTPRDANYPDKTKHHAFLIRNEAIRTFEAFCALEAHSKELMELGGDKDCEYRRKPGSEPLPDDDDEKLMTRRQEILAHAEKMKFDINALTKDSNATKAPQNILDIAKFVTENLIPSFIREVILDAKFVFDGRRLVDEMHRRGINARYLGRVLTELGKEQDSPLVKASKLIIESEMIARSFKTNMRRVGEMNLPLFLSQLNLLVGLTQDAPKREELFAAVKQTCHEKFGVTPSMPLISQKLLIMRPVLLAFGITVVSKNYDAPLTVDDVVSITPVVTFPFTRNDEFRIHIDLAVNLFAAGDLDSAMQLFLMASQDGDKVVSSFDKDLSLCYFYLGLIYEAKGNLAKAMNCILVSMITQERQSDQLSPDVIIRYSVLAKIASRSGQQYKAFACAARAAHLANMLCPFHPWVIQAFTFAGDMASLAKEKAAAMKYFDMALSIARSAGSQQDVVSICDRIVVEHVMAKDWKQALHHGRIAYEELVKSEAPESEAENMKATIELIRQQLALEGKQ